MANNQMPSEITTAMIHCETSCWTGMNWWSSTNFQLVYLVRFNWIESSDTKKVPERWGSRVQLGETQFRLIRLINLVTDDPQSPQLITPPWYHPFGDPPCKHVRNSSRIEEGCLCGIGLSEPAPRPKGGSREWGWECGLVWAIYSSAQQMWRSEPHNANSINTDPRSVGHCLD